MLGFGFSAPNKARIGFDFGIPLGVWGFSGTILGEHRGWHLPNSMCFVFLRRGNMVELHFHARHLGEITDYPVSVRLLCIAVNPILK